MRQNPIIFVAKAVFCLSMVSACAHRAPISEAEPEPVSLTREEVVDLTPEVLKADSEMERTAPAPELPERTELTQHPQILVEVNTRVERWVEYFTRKNPEAFGTLLDRGRQYRTMIETILEAHGVPKEFYYLALIESGFSNRAHSRARAVGIWQFICPTAVRYGLKCNQRIDERRNPYKATRAAAQYLRDLYNVFGSWRLAMAAYNAGEHRILSAIMKGKSRDFWTLADKGVLPSETMHYVPKFLAAVIIGRQPEKYGFKLPEGDPPKLAKHFSEAPLVVHRKVKSKPHRKVASKKSSKKPRKVTRVYRVQRGDTLSDISQKFGVPVRVLKRRNGLHGSRIYKGQKLRIHVGA